MTLTKELQDEILQNLALSGAANADAGAVKPIVATRVHLSQVLTISSGAPKITKKFELILGIPEQLKTLSPFNIRCCICRRVITFPCWYRVHKFNVNQFHFFLCHDSANPNKANCACTKKAI